MNESETSVPVSRRTSAREEYGEAAQSFRHYSALRFAIFSIYVAVIAALGGVALGVLGASTSGSLGARAAAVAAWLVTVVFFVCERKCLKNRRHFVKVMQAHEEILGYTSMTNFPASTVIGPAVAFASLFSVSLAFWSYVVWRSFCS
jgi:hypothetical protein